MEEDKKQLYPLKFCSILDEYSWGSEEFKIADLGYRDSLVREGWLAGNSISELMDTYFDQIVGEDVYDYYGRQFPVCIRELNVTGRLPLQVHPADELAAQRYDFLGKEKLWYILSAEPEARLYMGFKEDSDASELYAACRDGSLEGKLYSLTPLEGQCYHIPAGTIHGAKGKIKILEIAESSPLDFCVYGWGEDVSKDEFDPSLELSDALDFIDYKAFKPIPQGGEQLAELPEFRSRRILLSGKTLIRSDIHDSFALYSCIKGSARISLEGDENKTYTLSPSETLLVCADCPNLVMEPLEKGTVLIATNSHRVEIDKYTKQPLSDERNKDFLS